MVLDLPLYNSTSVGSAKKILVRCDECGVERLVHKQNLVKAKSHDCDHCRAVKWGTASKGLVRGDEHRRKTGLASSQRRPSEVTRALLIANARRGPSHHNWKSDRAAVVRNEKARVSAATLIHGTLRRLKTKKLASSTDLLGYSASDLATHLEEQFLPGMSWQERRRWHIDHIKPVSAFIAQGITDMRVICALSNLQPIWARDNLSKNATWAGD